MTTSKTLVFAGIVTLVQAVGQIFITGFSLAQYYCIIDFLREIPLVIFLRIVYLHNPETCGSRINIGQYLDNVPNSAFVFLRNEPFTTTRTFYLNCIYLGLCGVWILFSVVMILGGAKGLSSKHIRWPWVVVTSLVSVLDVVAIVTFANDSFHTRTLSETLDFIDATVSGIGNTDISTIFVSWTMVFIYSRLGVIFALNLCLVITITVECGIIRNKKEPMAVQVLRTADESVQVETASIGSDVERGLVLPRAGLTRSFRRMKQLLFKLPSLRTSRFERNTLETQRVPLPPPAPAPESDKKRTVNFPVNLLSLPQRLENLIAEQQRRLDLSVVDTGGRNSVTRTSQSLPQLDTAGQEPPRTDLLSRRGTAAELQGQLPWAYIPGSSRPMREDLPADEDLPPVPLPDYTAIHPHRKASVHCAASSISSVTRKKDYQSGISGTSQGKDVLY